MNVSIINNTHDTQFRCCIFSFRFIWMKSNRGKTYISSGILLPSKVTWLVIKRPFHFCFRPGDYVFINIPAIAKYGVISINIYNSF